MMPCSLWVINRQVGQPPSLPKSDWGSSDMREVPKAMGPRRALKDRLDALILQMQVHETFAPFGMLART
jgi:hypothetical protein